MSKRTPGDWEYVEPDNWAGIAGLVRTVAKAEPIAQIPLSGWPRGVGRANGELIALATRMERNLRILAIRLRAGDGLTPSEAKRLSDGISQLFVGKQDVS